MEIFFNFDPVSKNLLVRNQDGHHIRKGKPSYMNESKSRSFHIDSLNMKIEVIDKTPFTREGELKIQFWVGMSFKEIIYNKAVVKLKFDTDSKLWTILTNQ